MRFIHAAVLALFPFVCSAQAQQDDWLTTAERTGYERTSRYPETQLFAHRLAATADTISYQTAGTSPEGRDIDLLIVSQDGLFTAEAARASGKEIVFITAGIHPGEVEGKDAGLALLRDIAITGEHRELIENVIILFMPIFNVDGHERFGPFNRINQNGPAEMGWRTTAQNYNLNRDFVKVDTPEMRAWLNVFNAWQPDMVIDLHNTNGSDYQYAMTYAYDKFDNVHPALRSWQERAFTRNIFPGTEKRGTAIGPYIWLKDSKDFTKGFSDFAPKPRFSITYAAIRNRVGLLVEAHMLKDYRTRVKATSDLLIETLQYINDNAGSLRRAVQTADRDTIARGKSYNARTKYPVDFVVTEKSSPFVVRGYDYSTTLSPVSGSVWVQYDQSLPRNFTVPFYNEVIPTKTIAPPLAYVIPGYLTDVIERIDAHGIAYEKLNEAMTLEVETYRFTHVAWAPRPFEKHHMITELEFEPVNKQLTYPAGSIVIYLDQASANAVIHMLEPAAPDSLIRWGFFDQIFEDKEYAEDRVVEKMAREMMANNPELAREFADRIANDREFAADPAARLRFFYERSPYFDERLNIYPAGRLLQAHDGG